VNVARPRRRPGERHIRRRLPWRRPIGDNRRVSNLDAGPANAPNARPPVLRPRRLIGRDAELRAVTESIASAPVTTLTGPGGVGKTALAMAVVAACARDFPDGVTVVWLGSLRSAELVAAEFVKAVYAAFGAGDVPKVLGSMHGRRKENERPQIQWTETAGFKYGGVYRWRWRPAKANSRRTITTMEPCAGHSGAARSARAAHETHPLSPQARSSLEQNPTRTRHKTTPHSSKDRPAPETGRACPRHTPRLIASKEHPSLDTRPG
jgi:hypothetical protein